MFNGFNAREILAESYRNRSSKRIPFVSGQCFGLTINEDMSDACHLGPDSAAEVRVSASAATLQTTE